jgi:hypothetical protein
MGYDSNSFKNSLAKSQSQVSPLKINGKSSNIVDIQGIDKAFNSISNSQHFANTLNLILTPSFRNASLNAIPLLTR